MEIRCFNKLYNIYSKKLYNYALWLTRNKAACDDIIQTVFIKIWKQQEVPVEERELEAWLYTVTRNECNDFFRKCARFSKFRLKYIREKPLYVMLSSENKMLWNMLDFLMEEERSILFLHLRIGYSYSEVAKILNMKDSAVRVKAFRALEKLRKKYTKDLL